MHCFLQLYAFAKQVEKLDHEESWRQHFRTKNMENSNMTMATTEINNNFSLIMHYKRYVVIWFIKNK